MKRQACSQRSVSLRAVSRRIHSELNLWACSQESESMNTPERQSTSSKTSPKTALTNEWISWLLKYAPRMYRRIPLACNCLHSKANSTFRDSNSYSHLITAMRRLANVATVMNTSLWRPNALVRRLSTAMSVANSKTSRTIVVSAAFKLRCKILASKITLKCRSTQPTASLDSTISETLATWIALCSAWATLPASDSISSQWHSVKRSTRITLWAPVVK